MARIYDGGGRQAAIDVEHIAVAVVRPALDRVVEGQAAVSAKVAPLVEPSRADVGGQDVQVYDLAPSLLS